MQLSSTGFQLTKHSVNVRGGYVGTEAEFLATLIGDTDPASTHSVRLSITFYNSWLGNRCYYTHLSALNYIGTGLVRSPKTEPLECVSLKDVTNQNCDTGHGGWCGVHITQHQKNEGDGLYTENYRFDVTLFDNDQEIVGDQELLSIASGYTYQVGSTLPYTFGITAPNLDSDAVYMSYNGQKWGSNDQQHKCNFGGYDSGSRQGDFGFSC